jgi:hypothetical protein
MTGNGNNPNVSITGAPVKRIRSTGPLLILSLLFVFAAFLTWYFTWFGRELSDADISKYLVDEKQPRHVQHALLQIQQRIERGDALAKQWYPQLLTLAGNPETEFRLTVAWLMGYDNKSEDFHQALLKLVRDAEPIVRRNAALSLVRFNDATGRGELVAILEPYPVKATTDGAVASTLKAGSQIGRGALLGRITKNDGNVVELRSPLPGTVEKIVTANGTQVTTGATILTLRSDEASLWEALRGLALIGESVDLKAIEPYRQAGTTSDRIKQQATLTANSINQRATFNQTR